VRRRQLEPAPRRVRSRTVVLQPFRCLPMRPVSSWSRRHARGCVVALCVNLSLAACGGGAANQEEHEAEPTDSSAQAELGPTLPASSCGLPEGGYDDGCNSCLAANCCVPVEACKQDPGCAAQLSCIVRCQHADDPTVCSDACIPGAPDPGYLAYDDCSFQECRSSCWM
jgi:hypothetical protein